MITVVAEPLLGCGWPDPDAAEQAWEDDGGALQPRAGTFIVIDGRLFVDQETFYELHLGTRVVQSDGAHELLLAGHLGLGLSLARCWAWKQPESQFKQPTREEFLEGGHWLRFLRRLERR